MILHIFNRDELAGNLLKARLAPYKKVLIWGEDLDIVRCLSSSLFSVLEIVDTKIILSKRSNLVYDKALGGETSGNDLFRFVKNGKRLISSSDVEVGVEYFCKAKTGKFLFYEFFQRSAVFYYLRNDLVCFDAICFVIALRPGGMRTLIADMVDFSKFSRKCVIFIFLCSDYIYSDKLFEEYKVKCFSAAENCGYEKIKYVYNKVKVYKYIGWSTEIPLYSFSLLNAVALLDIIRKYVRSSWLKPVWAPEDYPFDYRCQYVVLDALGNNREKITGIDFFLRLLEKHGGKRNWSCFSHRGFSMQRSESFKSYREVLQVRHGRSLFLFFHYLNSIFRYLIYSKFNYNNFIIFVSDGAVVPQTVIAFLNFANMVRVNAVVFYIVPAAQVLDKPIFGRYYYGIDEDLRKCANDVGFKGKLYFHNALYILTNSAIRSLFGRWVLVSRLLHGSRSFNEFQRSIDVLSKNARNDSNFYSKSFIIYVDRVLHFKKRLTKVVGYISSGGLLYLKNRLGRAIILCNKVHMMPIRLLEILEAPSDSPRVLSFIGGRHKVVSFVVRRQFKRDFNNLYFFISPKLWVSRQFEYCRLFLGSVHLLFLDHGGDRQHLFDVPGFARSFKVVFDHFSCVARVKPQEILFLVEPYVGFAEFMIGFTTPRLVCLGMRFFIVELTGDKIVGIGVVSNIVWKV